ncbi:MAG: hypothetical protein IJ955_08755 [Oscillospiraceae bacterium]|nr:hypothetical protein [Oscillospiraceae bacterium]
MDTKNTTKFTVRIHPDSARKLVYIADYYGRSQNKQIDWLIKQCIIEFEKEHGKIDLEDTH